MVKIVNKKGFTILEVVVAMMIFAIAVSSMISSMGEGAVLTYESKDIITAAYLAEERIFEIERKLEKDGYPEDDFEDKGEFEGEAFEKYTWIERIKKVEIPDDIATMTKLLMGGESEESADGLTTQNTQASTFISMISPIIQTIFDLFESSIREVEVEVLWEDESEDISSFILTTHMIDFSNLDKASGLEGLLSKFGNSSSKTTSESKTDSDTK
ncbi:prepilin-type N-terminal cleavage/methylation domain-containing protein [bacterium]|nr:prepilin-type N-terminal cleavage/methylation domain-containing protein [bacterium]